MMPPASRPSAADPDLTAFDMPAQADRAARADRFRASGTVLFRGSIGENICLRQAGATQEKIIAAAKLANADEVIRGCAWYDSMVAMGARHALGRQRQRIELPAP